MKIHFLCLHVRFVGERNNINILPQVTALLGKTAYLNCRVKNLGNKTVSIQKQGLQLRCIKKSTQNFSYLFLVFNFYFCHFSIIYAHALFMQLMNEQIEKQQHKAWGEKAHTQIFRGYEGVASLEYRNELDSLNDIRWNG